MQTEPYNFGDQLIHRVRALRHPLCVGIDPYLNRIPPLFRRGNMSPSAPATSEAVQEFCCRILDLVAGRAAIVKPQIALFETMGWRGIRALEHVVQHARSLGLLVLLDAKRGDIAETAEGYASAYLSQDAPLAVDAITVNPYLGCVTRLLLSLQQRRRRHVVLSSLYVIAILDR